MIFEDKDGHAVVCLWDVKGSRRKRPDVSEGLLIVSSRVKHACAAV